MGKATPTRNRLNTPLGPRRAGCYEQVVRSGRVIGIRPIYPSNWEQIRQQVLRRAAGKCEECDKGIGRLYIRCDGRINKINTLQVSHCNHDSLDCRLSNLRALCPQCHGRHDKRHHWGHGGVTSAVNGTLTAGRFDLLLNRMLELIKETKTIEPGELEFLLAAIVYRWRKINRGTAAKKISYLTDIPYDQLLEPLSEIADRLELRGFAYFHDGYLDYALSSPMYQPVTEAAA